MSPPREIELKLDVPVHNLPRLTASSLLKGANTSMFFAAFCDSAVLGRVTVSSPFLKLASIL
jgi:hypothetical protein